MGDINQSTLFRFLSILVRYLLNEIKFNCMKLPFNTHLYMCDLSGAKHTLMAFRAWPEFHVVAVWYPWRWNFNPCPQLRSHKTWPLVQKIYPLVQQKHPLVQWFTTRFVEHPIIWMILLKVMKGVVIFRKRIPLLDWLVKVVLRWSLIHLAAVQEQSIVDLSLLVQFVIQCSVVPSLNCSIEQSINLLFELILSLSASEFFFFNLYFCVLCLKKVLPCHL